ncbi:unnamed protein product [Linum tenue]|uniref:EF-hand domain-containing protein n=1 Tax=Linum tenue TaxID=586396 RepID=A0AAV0M1H1_9ROSI|nr:unnamed protein product [Linum tenue]
MEDDEAHEQADRDRIFKRFDTNGDGKRSTTELGDCLKTLGSLTSYEVKRMMDEIDTDSDDYISYHEFELPRQREPTKLSGVGFLERTPFFSIV